MLGSYRVGFDLFGIQGRREFSWYQRDDEAAIAHAWNVTGDALRDSMRRFAVWEPIDVGNDEDAES